jgi:mRNA interferase MazF
MANLSPTEGSEQDGTRPILIVSRDAINNNSPVIVAIPITKATNKGRLYPSHVPFKAGDGGLLMDSVALCEQIRAISKTRVRQNLGKLTRAQMASVEAALKITLDLS